MESFFREFWDRLELVRWIIGIGWQIISTWGKRTSQSLHAAPGLSTKKSLMAGG
jgi:hypothetical protein